MGSGGRAGALPSFEACLLRTMATGHRCYIWREEGGGAQHIDCNPRLVEPMRAYLAGLDPVELLLQVSPPVNLPPLRCGAGPVCARFWACNPCWDVACAAARDVNF